MGKLLHARLDPDPGAPRPGGGDDTPTGVGSSLGAAAKPVRHAPIGEIMLPLSSACRTTGDIYENEIAVTDLVFSQQATRFCYREEVGIHYDEIFMSYAKEYCTASYQEFRTDNAEVQQDGKDILAGLTQFRGKSAALTVTATGNRAGFSQFL